LNDYKNVPIYYKFISYYSYCYSDGNINMLLSFIIFYIWCIYYSVNFNLKASVPFPSILSLLIVAAIFSNDSHIPLASYRILLEWPSPLKTYDNFTPSAMFILPYLSPSEYKMVLLLTLSLSACNSILLLISSGGFISLISYLKHSIPHFSEASLSAPFIF
jgi:hypothetical protein